MSLWWPSKHRLPGEAATTLVSIPKRCQIKDHRGIGLSSGMAEEVTRAVAFQTQMLYTVSIRMDLLTSNNVCIDEMGVSSWLGFFL